MKQPMFGKASRTQLVLGLAVLLLGTLVYLVDRPAGHVFFPSAFSLCKAPLCLFGRLGQSLPTFAHVLAFSLFTAVLLGGGRSKALAICLGWMVINAAFELGQHPAVAPGVVSLIPVWFQQVPILEEADRYFLHGTFDHGDMLSIALGALAAYVVIQRTSRREVRLPYVMRQ